VKVINASRMNYEIDSAKLIFLSEAKDELLSKGQLSLCFDDFWRLSDNVNY
jgi:hypothetical protein